MIPLTHPSPQAKDSLLLPLTLPVSLSYLTFEQVLIFDCSFEVVLYLVCAGLIRQ